MVQSPEADRSSDTQAEDEFRVSLENFEGPFDLLLSLISKRKMDITDVALSAVTDEFIAFIKGIETQRELDKASEFLVVAATLLDLKIAGLLPQGELVDAEDVALLEARDLLFARLLQYRAFKQAASWFDDRLETERNRHVRDVQLEARFRRNVPALTWATSLDDFASLAALAMAPKEGPMLSLEHLHAPLISVREQAAYVAGILQAGEPVTFRQLVSGPVRPGMIVARFIAVLELYRHEALSFEQLEPLGELTLRWIAGDWSEDNLASLGADYEG